MNSRVFLVLTVHKVAAAAKFAITARAGEKADADPLADLPTANAGSHRVNAPDDLVAWNTRIRDAGETSLDCRGVRVANTARLDANAHLVGAGILKRPPHFSELSWFADLNGFVGFTHFRCSLFDIRKPRRSSRGTLKEFAVRQHVLVTAAPPIDPPRSKLVFDKEQPWE